VSLGFSIGRVFVDCCLHRSNEALAACSERLQHQINSFAQDRQDSSRWHLCHCATV
jgi:hypothetical protein